MVCCLVAADHVNARCHHRFGDSVLVPVRSSLKKPKYATLLRRISCRYWSPTPAPALNSGRSLNRLSVKYAQRSIEKSWLRKIQPSETGSTIAPVEPSNDIAGSPSPPANPAALTSTPPWTTPVFLTPAVSAVIPLGSSSRQ